ncbi:MAG TPA: DUF3084 domain-containing protein [Candidatus Omnitrophota bacterium]|nr:DUF3084 domain-containing protein [Candidatus Omnitrophota bacterium]
MIYQFALELVLILAVVSGAIAYIGNYIGRFFGKKRLSLFGLRPRYTAMFFTVVSGALIALITFTTVILVSRDARTAFFGLEKMRAQIRQARSDLDQARKELSDSFSQLEQIKKDLEKNQAEIKDLTGIREKLKQEVDIATSRRVVFPAQETMSSSLITGGQGKGKAEADLNAAVGRMNDELKKIKAGPVKYDDDDYRSTVGYLANMEGGIILKIVAVKNITVGGAAPVKFSVATNELLFHKGDEIWHGIISGKLDQNDTEQRLKELIDSAENIAVKKGLIADYPGAMGAYPYSDIYDTVRRIRGYGTLTRVTILAAADIRSTGPLALSFKVAP